MMPFIMGALTGMAFGAVLYKVGASRYSRVMGMMTLRDTKVMKFTFATIGTASILYGLAAAFGVAEQLHLVPRVMPFMGYAHLVGGILFGVSMGLVGFCPGTCVAKAGGGSGNRRFSTTASIAGLFAGILIYAGIKDWLFEVGVVAPIQKPMTLHGLLGLPYEVVALVWGALFFVIALLVDRVTPEKHFEPSRKQAGVVGAIRGEWSWLASGLAGGTVIVLATMQDGFLGFSGAFLALTGWVAHLVGHPLEVVPAMSDDLIWRAALIIGVFPGGLVARWLSIPSAAAISSAPADRVKPEFSLSAIASSFGGGAGLALGAMIGGGCTTGAYLAAWPTLSVGSLAMGGTFFAASMLVANARLFSRKLDLERAQWIGDRVYD